MRQWGVLDNRLLNGCPRLVPRTQVVGYAEYADTWSSCTERTEQRYTGHSKLATGRDVLRASTGRGLMVFASPSKRLDPRLVPVRRVTGRTLYLRDSVRL